jgi:hypothetical protein
MGKDGENIRQQNGFRLVLGRKNIEWCVVSGFGSPGTIASAITYTALIP